MIKKYLGALSPHDFAFSRVDRFGLIWLDTLVFFDQQLEQH